MSNLNKLKEKEMEKEETVELYANFYKAVTSGDATRVTEFIQKGLDINYDFKECNKGQPTAKNLCRFLLIEAVINEHTKIVNILLYNNANVDAQDEDGTTPLMQAIYVDSLPIVQLILSHGASIDIEDKQKRTALHLAAQLNRASIIEAIIHLKRLTHPQLVDTANSEGDTPLLMAVKVGNFGACDTLILRGADPNKPDRNGRYPLHHAVVNGNERLTKYLLRNLAFPYKVDKMGVLPIALTTGSSIVSYLEDAYSQYSPEFRMYEELAVTSGLSRLLRYQFIHLLHFYEAFRRQRYYSSLTFDLAAAMVSEDWDSVQKIILSRLRQAADSGIVIFQDNHGATGTEIGPATATTFVSPLPIHGFSTHPEKSILRGCFFSYDAHEFYKQTMVVLQGVTSRMHTLSKECLSGQLHLTELYACAQVRQKLQSFILVTSPIMSGSNIGTTTAGVEVPAGVDEALSTCLSNPPELNQNSPVPSQVAGTRTIAQRTRTSSITSGLPGDKQWPSREMMATSSFDMQQRQQQLRNDLEILKPPTTASHVSSSTVFPKQQTQSTRDKRVSSSSSRPLKSAIETENLQQSSPPLIIAAIPAYSSTRARSTALMKNASFQNQSSNITSDYSLSVPEMEEDAVVIKNLLQLKAPSSDIATDIDNQQIIESQLKDEKESEQQTNDVNLDALSTITVASSSSTSDTIEDRDNSQLVTEDKEEHETEIASVALPPTPAPTPLIPEIVQETKRAAEIDLPNVAPNTTTQSLTADNSKSETNTDVNKSPPVMQTEAKTDFGDDVRPHAIVAEAFTRKRSRKAVPLDESKTPKRQKSNKAPTTNI